MDRSRLYNDLYYFSLILVIITLPFDISVNNISIIFHVLISIFYYRTREIPIMKLLRGNKVALLMVFYALAYVISSLIHFGSYSDLQVLVKDLEARAAFLLFPITLTGISTLSAQCVDRLRRAFIAMAALSSGICFLIAITKTADAGTVYSFDENNVLINNFMYHRFSHWIGIHAVYLSSYIGLAFFIVLDGIINNYHKYSRQKLIWQILQAIYFLAVVLLLKSITISLIVLLVLGGVLLYYSAAKFRFGQGAVAGIIISYMLLSTVFGYFMYEKLDLKRTLFEYQMDQMPPEANWNSFNLRLAKWEISRQVISDHWMLGVGPGNITGVMDKYYDLNNFYYAKAAHYNPHNQYLHSFIVLGVTGLILVLLIFYYLLQYGVARNDVVLAVFTLIFAFFCITESVFAVNKGIIFFSFIGCLLTYLSQPLSKSEAPDNN